MGDGATRSADLAVVAGAGVTGQPVGGGESGCVREEGGRAVR